MNSGRTISRRDVLIRSSSALAAAALSKASLFARGHGDERTIPFLDRPPALPRELLDLGLDMNLLDWEELNSWLTPSREFFRVGHYGTPEIDPKEYRLEITGLVDAPRTYTLDELHKLPKQEVVFTLECSGNDGLPWFRGGIGNARWGGTPLRGVLERAGVKKKGIEVVFFGADSGDVTVPYFDGDGIKLQDFDTTQNFARSMSLEDAANPANLLCYEINGEPLPRANGFPLRLIAPGWYGVANVKWLQRIEVWDTRFMGPFMTERYVTLHEGARKDGQVVWTRSSVGRGLLKSMTARVAVKDGLHRIYGAAWGAPIARVEVQIDDGPWIPAAIDQGQEHEFAWKFWSLDWKSPSSGEHRITSRAIDTEGNVQPAMDDPRIAGKHTYWESNGQITRTIRI